MIIMGELDKLKPLTDDIVTELKTRNVKSWFGNNGNRNWLGNDLQALHVSSASPFLAKRLVMFITLHIMKMVSLPNTKIHWSTGLRKVGYNMYVFNARLLEKAFQLFRHDNKAIWADFDRQLPTKIRTFDFATRFCIHGRQNHCNKFPIPPQWNNSTLRT